MKNRLCCLGLLFLFSVQLSHAQKLIADWTFHPNYTLYRNAENYPGNKIEPLQSKFELFKTIGGPIQFYGEAPTQRLTNFLEYDKIPSEQFTIEFWLLNHVNMPVGTMMALRNPKGKKDTPWLVGYYGDEVVFHLETEAGQKTLTSKIQRGWKKYWGHLVATYDGKIMKLYLNGKLLKEEPASGKLNITPETEIELAGYFGKEPYMEISNLVKTSRMYDYALDKAEITDNFEALQKQVEAGAFFADTFHFNAGPYLHYATQNSINILWETSQQATASIAYGTTLPLGNSKTITDVAYIQETTLDGLEAATPYFYEITATSVDGTEMKSGILTFSTAVEEKDAFSFCILGDTESRPHVNNRLGEMIWEERPNFLLHLGDITDGGKKPHKFEWNYEYFTGIVPVASRIPVFPVPGNGEDDLYWYERYHKLPAPEAYYSFRYGNAEFFMLNSNAASELKKGGKQYEWLKEQLAKSDAEWKFITHHHCPFSSDEDDFGNTWEGKKSIESDPRFDDLKPLYEANGIDVVFYGHVHAYERTYPIKEGAIDKENGIVYVKSGGAGGNLEDFAPTHTWFSNKIQRGNHYLRVDLFDNQFELRMYDLEGRLKDIMRIEK
ncbi:metallophosphoesterase [Flammeovirgaceae bacterium SG7u.111]|nr:metallophosphoesterase [Flammeovirgaceae bacterium SG7u.132]WPO37658.1 metallophosphoesterase [Flammeovirgaceae bacterium SG7u.111]